jgi:hypothetical protein
MKTLYFLHSSGERRKQTSKRLHEQELTVVKYEYVYVCATLEERGKCKNNLGSKTNMGKANEDIIRKIYCGRMS